MKISVKTYQIHANSAKDIRICHFSDTHFWPGYKTETLRLLVEKVKEIKPDYLCVTGDLLDQATAANMPPILSFLDFFHQLAEHTKILAILGNHDQTIFGHKKEMHTENQIWRKQLKEIKNFLLLENGIYEDDYIRCLGYIQNPATFKEENQFEKEIIEDIKKVFSNVSKSSKYSILLMHSPLLISKPEVQKELSFLQNIDVILCGHTHGGLLPIPFRDNQGLVGPYCTPFPRYAHGMVMSNPPVIIHDAIVKLSFESGFFHHFNSLFPIHINQVEILANDIEKVKVKR